MKKLITIILTLSMLVLLVVPSFADSKEEAVILEAAKKGTVVYLVADYGYPCITASMYGQEALYESASSQDETYEFMKKLIPDVEDRVDGWDRDDIAKNDPYIGEDGDGIQYIKLGSLVKTRDDMKKLVSTYLTGYSGIIDDENTVERYDNGCIKRLPFIRPIGDDIYKYSGPGNFNQASPFIYFEKFELMSYDGEKATVKAVVKNEVFAIFEEYTIELKKQSGKWKVSGGTLFSDFFEFHGVDFNFAPDTGENFSLVTHTIVIAVSVVLMVLLSKSRRKIDNI